MAYQGVTNVECRHACKHAALPLWWVPPRRHAATAAAAAATTGTAVDYAALKRQFDVDGFCVVPQVRHGLYVLETCSRHALLRYRRRFWIDMR